MSLHCTMTYHGEEEDAYGMPHEWFHYLVIASPGPKAGSGVASIVSLSEARATGVAQSPAHHVIAKEGGPEAALAKAEEYLNGQHTGLKKIISDKK